MIIKTKIWKNFDPIENPETYLNIGWKKSSYSVEDRKIGKKLAIDVY